MIKKLKKKFAIIINKNPIESSTAENNKKKKVNDNKFVSLKIKLSIVTDEYKEIHINSVNSSRCKPFETLSNKQPNKNKQLNKNKSKSCNCKSFN